LLMVLIGLYDDLHDMHAKSKLFLQIVVGAILFFSGIRVSLFVDSQIVSFIFTVGWVVFVTNAFNLLDNIDGLSAGVALIASMFLLLMCMKGGQFLVCVLLLIFMGAVAGFLSYNFSPARIFMGDCGSLFVGYMLSVLTIVSTYHRTSGVSLVPFAAPLLILSVPFYDVFSVIYIRIVTKKSIFLGDKNHFSHRLLKGGMTVRQAVLFIYLIAFCLGIAALSLDATNIFQQVILLVQAVCLLSVIFLLERIHLNVKKKGELV